MRLLLPPLLGEVTFEVYRHQCKDALLSNLPRRLKGYAARPIPNEWRIVVIVDRDADQCHALKRQLEAMAATAGLRTRTAAGRHSWAVVNRLAIEELEAWYFGDWDAVRAAYPKVPATIPKKAPYRDPDAIAGGTWEAFERVLQKAGYFRTGMRKIAPWWQVKGAWADDNDGGAAMVGAALAQRLELAIGDPLTVSYAGRPESLRVVGLVSTGGYEEDQIFVPLSTAQSLLGLSRGADKVLVSALVEPEEKLRADLRGLDPAQMTQEQYETWYCSPTMGAVLTQIAEALPGTEVKPIRQITEAEGAFLSKVGLLMTLLTTTALVASALAVMATMTANVLQRREEIGVMKAIGADGGQIALVFLSEAGIIGISGGLLGYVAGLGLAAFVGRQVFAAPVSPSLLVLPISLALALLVTLAGSALPVRQAIRIEPVNLLRGR